MKANDRIRVILTYLNKLFPNASCELNYRNAYELLIAVILSAQTTDKAVNKVTPNLFEKYPTPKLLAQGDLRNIQECIKQIGLSKSKSINIKKCAQMLANEFNSQVPSDFNSLISLPGVGRKTANVIRVEYFDIPSIPVDTHVERISKRLYLAKEDDTVEKVEQKLKVKIPKEYWNKSHHLFIFFGRYFCKAKNPQCVDCDLKEICRYYKKSHLK